MHNLDMGGICYRIPTCMSPQTIEALVQEMKELDSVTTEAEVFADGSKQVMEEIRNCKVSWLNTDCWIAGMMSHFIHSANRNFFNYELTEWASRIQYTLYEGGGKHYGWHTDAALSNYRQGEERKLSITLCLSHPDEYEGGELQLHQLSRTEIIKPGPGEAIVFSSLTPHRVRPLKSGTRRSLVGWFGGPRWK